MVKMSDSFVSRKFGLRSEEPGIKFPIDIFSSFEKAANSMIRAGIKLDDTIFKNNGLISVRYFYDKVKRERPSLQLKLKKTKLNSRALRCAAQTAYFAIQGYKRDSRFISEIANILSTEDISCLYNRYFPYSSFLNEAINVINSTKINCRPVSREYMKNKFRHVRNLLKKSVVSTFSGEIWANINSSMNEKVIMPKIVELINEFKEIKLKSFVRKLSRLMTKRVKRVKNNHVSLGKGKLDPVILKIIQKITTINDWQRNRKKWRKSYLLTMKKQLKSINLLEISEKVFTILNDRITPQRLLNIVYKNKHMLSWVSGDSFQDFEEFLVSELVKKCESIVAEILKQEFNEYFQKILYKLELVPWKLLKIPHFQSQSIPLGPDDGSVYDIKVKQDSTGTKISEIIVKLSFRKREIYTFRLDGVERFQSLIDDGFNYKKGSFSRKSGSGLILSIPFNREIDKNTKQNKERPIPEYYTIAGLDLGLKTFGVLSIDQCTLDDTGNWHSTDRNRGDIARYFIDQKQLLGKSNEWFLKGASNRKDDFINYKRQLVNLQQVAYRYQSKMKLYSNDHPENYRHKVKYWRLKREWKHVWRKINNIHSELIHQIASRIVSV